MKRKIILSLLIFSLLLLSSCMEENCSSQSNESIQSSQVLDEYVVEDVVESSIVKANFITSKRTTIECDNASLFDNQQEKHIPIKSINSVEELKQFTDSLVPYYDIEYKENGGSFLTESENYDSEFFNQSTLLIVQCKGDYGPVIASLDGIKINDGIGHILLTGVLPDNPVFGDYNYFIFLSCQKELSKTVSFFDAIYSSDFEIPIIESTEAAILNGVEVYYYKQRPIPVATGYPKLTDSEIDELVNSTDYDNIADKIETLADCANFFIRAGFNNIPSDYFGTYNGWNTHICGQQVIARRGGECGGMCNAVAYLLKDNYDLTYVLVDGHIMMAIYIDEYYYMINPADFFAGRMMQKAKSFREIADKMVAAEITKYRFMTYKTTGDMLPTGIYRETAIDKHEEGVVGPDWYFPEGTNVTDWLGNGVHYAEPDFGYLPNGEKVKVIDWRTGTDWIDDAYIMSY